MKLASYALVAIGNPLDKKLLATVDGHVRTKQHITLTHRHVPTPTHTPIIIPLKIKKTKLKYT